MNPINRNIKTIYRMVIIFRYLYTLNLFITLMVFLIIYDNLYFSGKKKTIRNTI